MNTAFIDIHTHRCGPEVDIKKICVYLLGRDHPLPEREYAAGVHPWDVLKVKEDVLDFFQSPPTGMIAVGEIGLDFGLTEVDKKVQLDWLNRQLTIAERLQLPVFLHCVKAYNEIQIELKKYKLKAVIFHGFIGSTQMAESLLKQGYYLSFGEFSLHSPKTLEVIKTAPAKCFFLETDDDPNSEIKRIYGEVAILRGTTMAQLKKEQHTNYKRIFNE